MATTPARIEANRQNALKSTGPRTAAGKLASSGNALRHGLLSKAALVCGEDPAEFECFQEAMQAEFQPVGPMEQVLVGRIVATAWRLGRVAHIEAGLLDWRTYILVAQQARDAAMGLSAMTDPDTPQSEKQCRLKDRAYLRLEEPALDADEQLASDIVTFARAFIDGSAEMGTLTRYETALERGLHRALHELQRLQAARAGQFVPAPAVLDVDVGQLDFAKRTQEPSL